MKKNLFGRGLQTSRHFPWHRASSFLLVLGILFGGEPFHAARAEFSAVVWGSTSAGKTNIPPAATNLVALATSQDHLLALREDGHIFAWGANSFGQTNVPVTATNIIQIAAGGAHNLVLRNDGVLVAWGHNIYGIATIPSAATNVPLAAIAAGVNHNLVLRTNGTVYVWGNPNIGITTPPARATNGLRIAAGRFTSFGHNLLLRRDGTAVGWGSSTYGQTNPPPTATNLVAVAAGGQFSLGLKADGTVVGWGENFSGQTTIPSNATNVVAIAAGIYHSLALRADGSIVGWGNNNNGKRNIPAAVSNTVAVAIAAGSEHSAVLLGDGAPRFVDALGDLVAYSNHVFHLNALAVGAPPMNYQWRFNDAEIPGADSGVLTFSSVQFTNAGAYSVVISNHLGVRTGLVANLTVDIQPTLPVVVTAPESQTVNVGSEVTFGVAAGGHPAPTYQWQYANTNIIDATNASYTIPYVRTNQAGNYRVVLSNSVGAITSSVATLTVSLPDWPVINTWPASRGVSDGSPVTLTVGPAPSAGPVTYTWQLNGTNLPNVSGPNLTFNSFTVADGGIYRVAVSNQIGGSLSPEFEIAALPVAAWGTGVLTNLPRALTNAIALSVGVQHAVALKSDGQVVAWGNDVAITGFFPPYTTNDFGLTRVPAGATNITGLAAGRYHTLAVRGDGTVLAWGRNIGGESTVPATATNVIAVAAGDAHSLALRADGTLIAWGTNNTGQINIPLAATNIVAIAAGDSHSVALRSDGQILVWGTPNTLVTTVPAAAANTVAIAARANYTVAIQAAGSKITWGSNVPMQTPFSTGSPAPWPVYSSDHLGAAGGFSHAVYLHFGGVECLYYGPGVSGNDPRLRPPTWLRNVVAVAAGNVSFALMQSPDRLPVRQVEQRHTFVGAPAVFSAHVEGQRAMSAVNSGRYQWRFNGENLTGETNRALVLPTAMPTQSGEYSVVLSNWSGAVTSQNASLMVAAPPVPEILQPPVSQTVGAGSSVTFSVALAYGIPGQLQWWFVDQEIPGATGANLMLTNVQAPQTGDYWVVVTNFSGSITSLPATLVVTAAPPVLVTQPGSVAKAPGLPVSFAVQAAGTEPIFYQWYREGEIIPAATNTILVLAAIQPTDFGAYVVVATNISGSVTSNPALLSDTGIAAWGDDTILNETIPITATNVIALAAGDGHALAMRADGTVVGWGNNSCGQATIPTAATNVVRIAANALRSLVLRDDGQVLVWGHTSGGVSTLPAGLSNVVEIAAGGMHNLALRGDGSVMAWGHNWSGHDITPPESATNVVGIAAGTFHSLALRADGTLVGWGNNLAGQITIPASATNLVSIAAGFNFSAGLRADGTVVAWGELPINPSLGATYSCGGASLRVGAGSVTNDLIALPPEATNIVALAAGREHLLMLRADGALIFVGNSDHGQDEIGLIPNVMGIAAGGNQNFALTGVPALKLGGHQTNRSGAIGAPVVLNPAVGGMSPRRGWRWQSPGGNFEPGLPHRFLAAPTTADQGEFRFVVTNAFGAITGAISLTLTASPPRLLTEPASQFATAGSDVSFTVTAAGTVPLAYQWQRNETNLTDGLELTGATTPTLSLLNVQSDTAANYRVVVTNSQGSAASSNAALVVFAADPLAVALDAEDLVWTTGGPGGWHWQSAITQDGVDAAETGPYLEDQTNWIETTVTGPTAVSFWWRAFGWITDRFSFSVNGVERLAVANDFNWQQRSYYLPAGMHTLRWTYVCEPFAGTSTAWLDQVVLTNAILPVFTTQPTSRSVQGGANTTFSSAASGTEPFNYQWWFNDADVSGATNATLTLSQVQPTQAGNYTIVVSNVVGVVTSQVAVLMVNDSMPTIQFTSSLLTAAPGTASSFNSTILGSSPLNIVWQRNQQNLPDTTSSSLVLSNLQPAQAGKYRVVAANAFGTAFSQEAELVIVPVATWGSSLFQARVPAHVGDVVGLAGGATHSVALRRDGTVVYWGNYMSVATSFTALAGEDQLIAVAAANNHDLGLRADGTVIVFGNITSYGLGDIPAEATNIVAIATSGQHNLALRADGNVISWGENPAGLLSVPSDATNLVGISAAVGYSLALRDTGALRAWGRNDFGQLNVPAGNDYLAVAAGYRHAVALREDGTVVAWGDNEHGQTNVPPGLSNVVAIATRNYHTLALRQDGKVFAWGQNTLGQTDIWPTLTNVVGIAAGSSHSLALVGDGRPVVNLPPMRRRIESGADAVLRVLATGAGPLHYQWQHDGTNIPGATNATLLVSGGGNYSVTVSNQLGNVESPAVPVIVTPPMLRFDSAPGAIQLLADGLHLRLLGASGCGPIVVLASADFTAWTPIWTNPPVVGEWAFVDAAATNLAKRFYRAVELETPILPPLQFISPVYANTPTGTWFRATLTGLSGSGPVTIFGSSNLVDWQALVTNAPVNGEWNFEHTAAPEFYWYRAAEQR